MNKTLHQFNLCLDRLLGITPMQTGLPAAPDPAVDAALQTAGLLTGLDLTTEAAPRLELRQRWAQPNAKPPTTHPGRVRFTRRLAWVVALILALALLVAFRQPVLAAVGRLFGYIYVQDSGFLPVDSTLVLQQPVLQTHNGLTLTATHAVSTPEGTTLYLEFSATASPADGAYFETGAGAQLALTYWEYFPNTSGSHGLKLGFPALPGGTSQTSLVLPAGWHLPLTWIPAAQSGLPDVRAVPYVNATQSPAPAADLCVEKHGVKLCLQAATSAADDTSVLVDATPTNPAFNLMPWLQGLIWQSRTDPVTLKDEHGNIYPLDIQHPPIDGTLFFPPLTGAHTLTLTIPEVYANVNISQQDISVDVGADPQPGVVIPLDANIQVLGTTVHFSKATFIGDGTSTLRLTLNADAPIQTVDGLTPDALELGRPARVDDLYGGGALVGGKGLFVELILGGKKITGVLDLPIVSATVIVQGPFTFTFNLSDLPALTPTPLVANPNAFLPAPSPTPMSLDSYAYRVQTLQTGDLLYAAWNGSQSDVYRYTPASGTAPTLFLTLPGRVVSIHLHTDRAGMDYLTGTFNPDMIVESTALYTLRFSDPRPRLLHTSPEGIITYPVWSFDGRLMAFAFQLPDPGELWPRVGWIDMNCRSSGECPVQVLDAPTEYGLSASAFSPQGYWLALNGVDTTYAAGEIYLLQFDNNAQPGQVQNITNTGGVFDDGPQWIAGNKLAWNCTISDANDPNRDIPHICLQDISSGSASPQKIFTDNDFDFVFGLSSQGNYFWQNVFVRIDPGSYQMWLHDRKGGSRMLSASAWFDQDYGKPAFSLDERYLAYYSESYYDKTVPETLHIAKTATGKELATFENINPVGWMGWVP